MRRCCAQPQRNRDLGWWLRWQEKIKGGRAHLVGRGARRWPAEPRASAEAGPPVNCVKARWTIEASFGRKGEALNLMKDWVVNVASKAGVDSKNVTLCSGAVGAPESRIELEIGFPDVGAWEKFLSHIPAEGHKSWSKKMEPCIIDGSPTWSVFYLSDIPVAGTTSDGDGGVALSFDSSSSGLVIPEVGTAQRLNSAEDFTALLEGALSGSTQEQVDAENLDQNPNTSTNDLTNDSDGEKGENSAVEEMKKKAPPGSRVVLDWKGDPMIVRPGDNLPFV